MKAVAYYDPGAIDENEVLVDLDLPEPEPTGRDLLVEVRAVSVNPIDTKVRRGVAPQMGPAEQAKVLGWDAAGVVTATGPDARLFQPGDEVWYAGEIMRPGSNAERQLVDERIVGCKPRSLDFEQAAALPLTTITAWELLFERLGVAPGKNPDAGSLLIVGAGGGVGSILVQLAARLTGLDVIATASRPETAEWVKSLGAHAVLDHSRPLSAELERAGLAAPYYAASLTHTDTHLDEIVACLAPQGRLALIDDPPELDVTKLKPKCLSLHWELMFTRSLFATPDIIAQHRLLDEAAQLVDAGVLRSTLQERFGRINATNLQRAHAVLESGRSRGKIVLSGF
jgi:zinc-binding alcohol dehydrogenase family protein